MIEWIPYSMITNIKPIAEGGFSFIYQTVVMSQELFFFQYKQI